MDSIGLQTVAYAGVASTAALFFDFGITFESEVRWTWGRKWGFTRVVFVVSRYLPLVTLPMTIYYTIESTRGGVPNYRKFSIAYDGVHYLGIAAAEVLLLVRTYVFWGCQRRFLIVLLMFSMVIFAAALGIASISASKTGIPTTGVYEDGWNASIMYGLLMFYELSLMSLTIYRRIRVYKLEGSPVVATIYRDGVVYMLCITLVSMANCIVIAVLPLAYSALFDGPQIVAHSVLASRVLFNLRETTETRDLVTFKTLVSHPFAVHTPSHTETIGLEDLVK
ncbi:hypothetical protein M405DRAFT_422438 [Rhizopogon salebrosus TDB-379]|nr:hypothetical protein M405DRAFT_422438 [Rhizopogon salebrosus TDB-379]